ncbi:hypothetical protein ADUPG1_009963 [Aduncisulcus paluster]|uniref:Uncharacterized protein n=1 Tax=Aduncisulcus paluster TaxID=2918883 RepID=A0ABQ5KXE0_9EUKA|nr:hypothetical protein ADUPG1_009963 [Aduncisulcus paluster]
MSYLKKRCTILEQGVTGGRCLSVKYPTAPQVPYPWDPKPSSKSQKCYRDIFSSGFKRHDNTLFHSLSMAPIEAFEEVEDTDVKIDDEFRLHFDTTHIQEDPHLTDVQKKYYVMWNVFISSLPVKPANVHMYDVFRHFIRQTFREFGPENRILFAFHLHSFALQKVLSANHIKVLLYELDTLFSKDKIKSDATHHHTKIAIYPSSEMSKEENRKVFSEYHDKLSSMEKERDEMRKSHWGDRVRMGEVMSDEKKERRGSLASQGSYRNVRLHHKDVSKVALPSIARCIQIQRECVFNGCTFHFCGLRSRLRVHELQYYESIVVAKLFGAQIMYSTVEQDYLKRRKAHLLHQNEEEKKRFLSNPLPFCHDSIKHKRADGDLEESSESGESEEEEDSHGRYAGREEEKDCNTKEFESGSKDYCYAQMEKYNITEDDAFIGRIGKENKWE